MIRLALRFRVCPVQTGELLDSVGADGGELMITFTVPALLVQPFTVIVTEYEPASAPVTLLMVGFCKDEEKAFGPVHAYVAPATVGVVRFNVAPIQIGLLLDGIGAVGIGFTTTVVVPNALGQSATVAVTE